GLTVDIDDGSCTATGVALGTSITSDNCSIGTVVNDGTEPYNVGLNTIIWTVTDLSGNSATCSQELIVEDGEDPVIVCPADLTIDANHEMCSAINVNLGAPDTSDNCMILSVNNDLMEPLPQGNNLITWRITDVSGNTSSCVQQVFVNDCVMAIDDHVETENDEILVIDIYENDINVPDNGTLSFIQPPNGEVVVTDPNNTPDDPSDDIMTYIPDITFTGIDSFEYTITDSFGNSSTALVTVTIKYVDIAIQKTEISSGPYKYGDQVEFNIEVFNQGLIDLVNIEVKDFIPCGFKFVDSENPDWTFDPVFEVASTLITDSLYIGTSISVQITLEARPCYHQGGWMNIAEIISMEDFDGIDRSDDDIDSDPDDDPDNDEIVDDILDNLDGDEDDHDIESIEIFDLALFKTILTPPFYNVGDTLEFEINVINQGNIPATNIVINDYLPVGYELDLSVNIGWDNSNAPNYKYTIIDHLAAGDTAKISMKTILQLTEDLADEEYTNIAEIASATDTLNNVRDDVDSTPDDILDNDTVSDDVVTSTDNDEDDHDIELIDLLEEFIYPCENGCDIQCNALIHVSLDENCMAEITPAMGGIGIHERCNDYYDITVYDENGIEVPDAKVDLSHVGQDMTFKITEPLCKNSCWGNLIVEYKLPPIIICPPDLSLTCAALDLMGLPEATAACSPYNVELIDEQREVYNCDPEYTHKVTRTYRAYDDYGNESTCSHDIYLKRIDFSQVIFPEPRTVVNGTALECSDSLLEYDENGIPLPWSGITNAPGAGVPVLCDPAFTNGIECPLDNSNNAVPLIPGNNQLICGAVVSYTDVELPQTSCVRKIIRTWEIREWWCSNENTTGSVQIIEIVDSTAPVVECPDDFTTSTTGDCIAEVNLPSATHSDNCSFEFEYGISYASGYIETNGGMAELEIGDNIITYTVYDECYNSGSCQLIVHVEDLIEPVAICEPFTVASLDNDSTVEVYAETFDDGSWDDCGIEKFEVRRMDTSCVASDTIFGDSISFCCSDLDEEVMVAFRVIDISGNSNVCMVRVEVQDNIPPIITCPENLTIDCGENYDLNNLDISFGTYVIEDNCSESHIPEETVNIDINQCGLGIIERTFEIQNDQGITVSQCFQNIHIVNSSPFNGSDIQWPGDYNIEEGCLSDRITPEALPNGFGYPLFNNDDDECSLLGYDYVDNEISQGPGIGQCVVIERTWTVINWCSQVNGQFESWTNPVPQIITISNSEAPVLSAVEDVLFESHNIDCETEDVFIKRTASDDCSDVLAWRYIITNSAGDTIYTGSSHTINHLFEFDTYYIEWTVSDACGNSDRDVQELVIRSTQTPHPICINGLAVSLVAVDDDNDGIPDDERVTLWASDIDGGSYHACDNPFVLSLSPDTTVQSVVFDCSDLGVQTVNLWVTDVLTGAQDYCSTYLVVQDNNQVDVCEPLEDGATVSGNIYTEIYEEVEDVQVDLGIPVLVDSTESDGQYAFENMPLGGAYLVTPFKNDDFLNGVTTLDLVLIQRHILALERLDSPYKMIAADIDRSKHITARDLIELRKLILGIYTELPENTSWRFIEAEYNFPDITNPWIEEFPENYAIDQLDENMDIDFIAAKIGDVNNDAKPHSFNLKDGMEGKSTALVLDLEATELYQGELTSIKVTSSAYSDITGWQGTLEFDPEAIDIVDVIPGGLSFTSKENINMANQDEGWISFSYNGEKEESVNEEEVLFEIIVKANKQINTKSLFELSSRITPLQAYRGYDEVIDIRLDYVSEDNSSLVSIYPNPWVERAEIHFALQKFGRVEFEFYDVNGQLIFTMADQYEAGHNTVTVERSQFVNSGIVYVKMKTDKNIFEHKMIIID
ncbi:MAG: HYR domain-containing protein, partial [Bacteroidia bacterium]|nr:HYR domain-containing protein [Bacteroidia bacterium]